MKKRALGRGLDALLFSTQGIERSKTDQSEQLRMLPIDIVVHGQYQPRVEMDPAMLAELSASIKQQGVIQPIVVRPLKGSDNYEIIAGERRWRATQMAGLHEIPAIIKDVTDQAAMCMALIENIQREDLNPLDEAQALSRLLKESGMSHQQAAEAVGRSRSTVTNLLRLMDLHVDVQNLLKERKIEMGHGRAIMALDISKQVAAVGQIVQQGLSVRATEQLVKRLKNQDSKKGQNNKKSISQDADIRKLQQHLSQCLGTVVAIKHSKKTGKGTLVINYHSSDELEGILKKMKLK